MICSTLPDVNVWVALTIRSHVHHSAAYSWYRNLPQMERPGFCRITQLAFLRLLTQKAVAGKDVCSQQQAWEVYDRLLHQGGAIFLDEPLGVELEYRAFADRATPSPKEWNDSYLAGFAAAQSLTLVTFDRALSRWARRSQLLT